MRFLFAVSLVLLLGQGGGLAQPVVVDLPARVQRLEEQLRLMGELVLDHHEEILDLKRQREEAQAEMAELRRLLKVP